MKLIKLVDLIVPPVPTENEYRSRSLLYCVVGLVGFGSAFALFAALRTFNVFMTIYFATEAVMVVASFCHSRRVRQAIREQHKGGDADHRLKLDSQASQDGPGLFPMPVQYDFRLRNLTSGFGIAGLVGWFLFVKFTGAM